MQETLDAELEKNFSEDVSHLRNALRGYALIQGIGLAYFVYFSNIFIDQVSDSKGELFLVLTMLLPAIAGHNIYMFNEFFSAYNYISGKSEKYTEKIEKLKNPYVAVFVFSIACQIVAIICSGKFHPEFWDSYPC